MVLDSNVNSKFDIQLSLLNSILNLALNSELVLNSKIGVESPSFGIKYGVG